MTQCGNFLADHAIVVGFGSIGARHAEILEGLGLSVSVVSRRNVGPYPRFDNIAAAVKDNSGAYVVVATETSHHATSLAALRNCSHDGPVLVEKPLFAKAEPDDGVESAIVVGYNLRFHPLLMALRARLENRKIHSVATAVGQYLPDWRPGRDYRTGYSANRAEGGGVLRDLSHEIDYMLWLFGPWDKVMALTGRSGMLDLETEDFAHLLIQGRDFAAATLGLDYLDRNVRRAITVHHEDGTTRLDFIAGTLVENGEIVDSATLDRNETYRRQHLAVLRGESGTFCSYGEGLAVVAAIEAIETSAETGKWISPKKWKQP